MTFDQKMRFLTLAFDENDVPFAGRKYTLTWEDLDEIKRAPFTLEGAQIYGITLHRPLCKECGGSGKAG